MPRPNAPTPIGFDAKDFRELVIYWPLSQISSTLNNYKSNYGENGEFGKMLLLFQPLEISYQYQCFIIYFQKLQNINFPSPRYNRHELVNRRAD